LVLVNKGAQVAPSFFGDFYDGNYTLLQNKELNMVKRASEIQDNGKTLYFKSILDRQNDNVFDIIDRSNIEEYRDKDISQANTAKKYRNKTGKPILLVYLAQTDKSKEIEVFPLLYCFIPIVEGAKKVTYIVRNK